MCVLNVCGIAYLQGAQSAGWNSGANLGVMTDGEGTCVYLATAHGLLTIANNGTLTLQIDNQVVWHVDANGPLTGDAVALAAVVPTLPRKLFDLAFARRMKFRTS